MKTRFDFWCLTTTGILFGLFVLNVLLGKAALSFGFEPIVQIGDVGEFLVLFAAVIVFVVEVLRREMHEANSKTKAADTAEEESK
jgi:hypothetical protein